MCLQGCYLKDVTIDDAVVAADVVVTSYAVKIPLLSLPSKPLNSSLKPPPGRVGTDGESGTNSLQGCYLQDVTIDDAVVAVDAAVATYAVKNRTTLDIVCVILAQGPR